MTTVAITGATGLIGDRVIELLNKEFSFLPLTSHDVDITNRDQVKIALQNTHYDILLHLAGYTNVNGAEQEREKAYAINVTGTQNLYDVTVEKKAKFIYISTDFVFDGTTPPYFEDSKPHPIGYYGQTKYEGELIVKDQAMIVRPSFPYRKQFDRKKDFMRTIKSLLEQKKELKMVTDSLITPTYIDDIAYALRHLMTNFTPDVYHIVGSSSMSPFDAGKLIAQTFGLDGHLIQPTTFDEYFAGKAQPPRYSEIKSKKNTFQSMKSFEEGLRELV